MKATQQAPDRPGQTPAPPIVRRQPVWSIGIYTGPSPVSLSAPAKVQNPVLSAQHISDIEAAFIADPFMVAEQGRWFMFFEVLAAEHQKGVIGLATSSDAFEWTYRQVVLEEPFHLSYPYVFKWQGEYYMVPEALVPNCVRLYHAATFPTRWTCVGTLVEGRCADPSLFFFDNIWWLLVCTPPGKNETLRLYHADFLLGPWREHPRSPIITGNPHIARPGGRVVCWNGKPVRFTQDCSPQYGARVRAFQIIELSRAAYTETPLAPSPVLGPGNESWNNARMHHVDPHRTSHGTWIACVDGCARE